MPDNWPKWLVILWVICLPGITLAQEDSKESEDVEVEGATIPIAAPVAPAEETPKEVCPPGSSEGPVVWTHKVEPVYPTKAKRVGTTGDVVYEVLVDETGLPVEITWVKGNTIFSQAGEDALAQWRAKPMCVEGKLTKFRINVRLAFSAR